MPNASDSENLDSTTPPASDPGQPTDWEARFKGLQKTFNSQSSTLKAKDDALAAVVLERDQLKSGNNQALVEAQALIAQRQNDLTAAQTAKQTLEQQLVLKDQELGKLQTIQQARTKLTALKATDLIPALDTGVLVFDSLDDTAVQAKITSTRAWLATLGVGSAAAQTPDLSGSSLPAITPSTTGTPDVDALFDWVNNPANLAHPDYQKNSDAYFAALAKKK